MDTLNYIFKKYNLTFDGNGNVTLEIPNVGRDNMASLLRELGFRTGVEVGVGRGTYSEVLCRANPQMKLYGVDPWEPFEAYRPRPTQNPEDKYVSQEWCDIFFKDASERMSKYSNYEIIKKTSMEAVKQFPDGSLDFVYIDGNHAYSYVMDDINAWSQKVCSGGIIAGHDYYRLSRNSVSILDVKQAVNNYVTKHKIKPLILWGKENLPGMVHDGIRSWSWVQA